MPCPNDHRERCVTVAFRVTPAQKEWLDQVSAESGMTKQDFIMMRLADEKITVTPNVRVYRALRENMRNLHRELVRICELGEVDERIAVAAERFTREFGDLRGEAKPAARPAADNDIFGIDRR